jgi:hypothetical protein
MEDNNQIIFSNLSIYHAAPYLEKKNPLSYITVEKASLQFKLLNINYPPEKLRIDNTDENKRNFIRTLMFFKNQKTDRFYNNDKMFEKVTKYTSNIRLQRQIKTLELNKSNFLSRFYEMYDDKDPFHKGKGTIRMRG